MFNLSKLTVRAQLSLAFGAFALIVLIVSLMSLRQLGASNDRFADYLANDVERMILAADVRAATNRRAIGARNIVLVTEASERESERAGVMKAHEKLQSTLAKLKDAIKADPTVSEKEKALFAAIEQIEAKYGPVALEIVRLGMDGKKAEAIDKMNKECRPLLAAMLDAVIEYVNFVKEESQQSAKDAAAAFAAARTLLLAVAALAVALAVGMGFVITRGLTNALGAEPGTLGDIAMHVATGDLSPVQGADRAPKGSVLASMGEMQKSLVKLIGEVRQSAGGILSSSVQIAQGNQDLSGRTEQQASSLEETAASMEEMASTVQANAEATAQASQLAVGAADHAGRGSAAIGKVESVMNEISESSRRITDIIGVIDGIAFQTNILALNAAVEAARAGEQGRGFAVVAAEVRTLAQRSAEAAKDIKGLIGESAGKVEEGSGLVTAAVQAMTQIRESVQNVTSILESTKTAAAEQSAGIQQVNTAVSQLDEMTQQNAALVEQSTAAADSMKDQARKLSEAVSQFRLDHQVALAVSSAPSAPSFTARAPVAPAPVKPLARKAPTVAPRRAAPAPAITPSVPASVPVKASKPAPSAASDDWEEF